MEEYVIEHLMVGLPVNQMGQSNALAARLRGVHPLPGGRNVIIVSVNVIPQPLGCYYYYASQLGGGAKLRQRRTLIIDPGFYTLDWLVINGNQVDLSPYIHSVAGYIEESIGALRANVGAGMDIDTIVFVGGGATHFQKTVERAFPHHKIHLLNDHLMANVKGFQLLGKAIANQSFSKSA